MVLIIRRILLLLTAAGVSWADQVVLKNGDRVTGSIVKKDDKTLTVNSEFFGVVNLPWEQVVSVTADTPLNVVLPEGKTIQGKVTTADGKVVVTSTDSSQTVPPGDVIAIRNADEQKAYERLLHPAWRELWAGGGSLAWAGTRGNAQTATFAIGLNAARATRTDATSLYFNTIKASAFLDGKSADTALAVRGGWGYKHNIRPRLFANAFNDYEYDKFQNLDLRFVLGGGAGYIAMKNERSRLDLLGGVDYNRETFSTPLTRSSAEVYWGDDFAFKLSNATSFVESARMFNNLTNTGAYRVNFDIGANTKVAKWLTWTLAVSDRYLSNPVSDHKKNDLLYSTGIGFTFAK